ncbi:metallophosphoesterase [uncultured Cetobacterium sp.]|uniref:metallophosphoesterase n=1 Tax=uncultured Cetobacterium sp. TaxID=527638 RepID=UPI0026319951|nr:metallophosphoesterase [uncultured Cetobacterium sp.]
MKVLIVSDSHGDILKFYELMTKENPNVVFWTGDFSSDGEECSFVYPEIPFYIVRGNCDMFDKNFNDNEIIEIEGKKILLTHGHLFNVKNEKMTIEKYAETLGVDAVSFGHTHIPYLKKEHGIVYFNPGALRDENYGILNIYNNEMEFINKKLR